MPLKKDPSATSRTRGFSLVLSLTVMAMLLLICIGAASLLAVELRVAQASSGRQVARMNALAGARIALGEIQRLLGPDQRVTANADILGGTSLTVSSNGTITPTPKDAAYYSGPNGTVVHPRWVGVWNSGKMIQNARSVPSTTPSAAATSLSDALPAVVTGGPAAGEAGKVIQRTVNGGLYDSRFPSTTNDWQIKDRVALTGDGARLMSWLVSGNEALPPGSANALSPIATTIDPSKDVVLLGTGTLGTNFDAGSTSSDLLGARARLVSMVKADSSPAGQYAYWVSDLGVKAKLNVVDRTVDTSGNPIVPSVGAPNNGGYYRVLTSQRNAFAVAKGLDGTARLAPADTITPSRIGSITSFNDYINVSADTANKASDLAANYYSDVTFFSKGVIADVVNGGLRKDLTALTLGKSGATVGDYSGVLDTDPLVKSPNYKAFSPTFAYLKNWLADGVPLATGSASVIAPKNTTGLDIFAMPYQTVDFTAQDRPPRHPILTQMQYYFTMAKYVSGTDKALGFGIAPVVTLWNPYPVSLSISGMSVHMTHPVAINTSVRYTSGTTTTTLGTSGWTNTGPILGSLYAGGSTMLKFDLPAVTIPAGESVTFTSPPGVTKMARPLYQSPFNPALSQGTLQKMTSTSGFYFAPSDGSPGGVAGTRDLAIINDPAAVWGENNSQGLMYSGTTGSNIPQRHVFLLSGNQAIQHADLDSYASDGSGLTFTYSQWVFAGLLSGGQPGLLIPTLPGPTPNGMTAGNMNFASMGWRVMAMDEPGGSIPVTNSSAAATKNVNFNYFAQNNFLSPKHVRYPQDGQSSQRSSNAAAGGFFQYEASPQYFSTVKTSPIFFTSSLAPSTIPPADVAHKEFGVYSIAALQHCPMSLFPWMPAFAVGNSYAHPTVRTETSAPGTDRESKDWATALLTASGGSGNGRVDQLPEFYLNYRAAQSKSSGATPLYLMDLSYELNYSFYDSWHVSGMGVGPVSSGLAWQKDQAWNPVVGNSMNSRYVADGSTHDCPSPIYAAAAGMMLDGAFNINSTSQAAWASLLASARNATVPTAAGNDTLSGQTPFLFSAKPLTKDRASSTTNVYNAAAWTGYRTLTDDEINVLAAYMVQTVRERGPFLGLSDFVNRRLRFGLGQQSGAYWEFTGAIQAAIDRATRKNKLINSGLEPNSLVAIARTPDATGGVATYVDPATGAGVAGVYNSWVGGTPTSSSRQRSMPSQAANRVVSKGTGVPGYLTQADVLQNIGGALSARSDTFTIRAMGRDDSGSTAVVELTVQRRAEALIPFNASTNGSYVPDHKNGIQRFGRRFQVVATRWLDSDEV